MISQGSTIDKTEQLFRAEARSIKDEYSVSISEITDSPLLPALEKQGVQFQNMDWLFPK
jgi:hypothetical protein